ncbi:MAG TPA: group III truncated hemoglobin [Silvibacterium sp.]|jgi:hemoglobin|nr:group III truncated hemoglobin [Silvibacterium sp.]
MSTTASPLSELNDQSIVTLVDRFYTRIREDALLGPVFDGVIGDNWSEHLSKLTDFWSSVLLASRRYKGNPMMAHLPIPQMDGEHFSRWIELWRETTLEIFGQQVSADLVRRAESMGERLVAVSTQVRESQPAS